MSFGNFHVDVTTVDCEDYSSFCRPFFIIHGSCSGNLHDPAERNGTQRDSSCIDGAKYTNCLEEILRSDQDTLTRENVTVQSEPPKCGFPSQYTTLPGNCFQEAINLSQTAVLTTENCQERDKNECYTETQAQGSNQKQQAERKSQVPSIIPEQEEITSRIIFSSSKCAMMNDINEPTALIMPLFTTGSGKPIKKPNQESLQKAEKIFGDLFSRNESGHSVKELRGEMEFPAGGKETVLQPGTSGQIETASEAGNAHGDNPVIVTGSGKTIKAPSKDSFERAATLISGTFRENALSSKNDDNEVFSGFQRTSCLSESGSIAQSTNENDEDNPTSSCFGQPLSRGSHTNASYPFMADARPSNSKQVQDQASATKHSFSRRGSTVDRFSAYPLLNAAPGSDIMLTINGVAKKQASTAVKPDGEDCARGVGSTMFSTASGSKVSLANEESIQFAEKLLQASEMSDSVVSTRDFRLVDTPKKVQLQKRVSNPKLAAPLHKFVTPRRVAPVDSQHGSNSLSEKAKRPRRSLVLSPMPMQPLLSPRGPLHGLFKDRGERRPMTTLLAAFSKPKQLHTVSHEIISLSPKTAAEFRVRTVSSESNGFLGHLDFKNMLIDAGADPRRATAMWVQNHYRWIVWNLASYQRQFAEQWAENLLNEATVLDQLKYRYEKEFNLGHRSALRKITERDRSAATAMVLCVAGVLTETQTGDCTDQHSRDTLPVWNELELSDGWYSIRARVDSLLQNLLVSGKIYVGQKLLIQGAALLGSDAGMPPLDAFPLVKLHLHYNGTRRAQWWQKLGFYSGDSMTPPLRLSSVRQAGGRVPLCLVLISRIYPVLHCERQADGRNVVRTQQAEDRAADIFRNRRQSLCEEASIQCMSKWTGKQLTKFRNSSAEGRLMEAMEASEDPNAFFLALNELQQASLNSYRNEEQRRMSRDMERATNAALEEGKLLERQVSSFLRLRVSQVVAPTNEETMSVPAASRDCQALVTVWQPSPEQVEYLEEGGVFLVTELMPRQQQAAGTCLQLSSTSRTSWMRVSTRANPDLSFNFSPRRTLNVPELHRHGCESEFDVEAVAAHVEQPQQSGFRVSQWLFLVDAGLSRESPGEDIHVLAVQFVANCNSFVPLQERLCGSLVVLQNLTATRYDSAHGLFVAEATDITRLMVAPNQPGSWRSPQAMDKVGALWSGWFCNVGSLAGPTPLQERWSSAVRRIQRIVSGSTNWQG